MTDMMSDMKTAQDSYTVRDLNRRTAEVLRAAAELGSVTIRSRGGGRFVLKPDVTAVEGPLRLPDFRGRWKKLESLGYIAPTKVETKRLDRIIAGEE